MQVKVAQRITLHANRPAAKRILGSLFSSDSQRELQRRADCCGGGAAGDSVCTLKALLEIAPQETALVPVVDPLAAATCQQAGEGAQVTVELGHQLDLTWGKPVSVTGHVRSLSPGQFQYRGGIWDGTEGQMGSTAVLQVGGISILITSFATYEWCGEQFEALGLEAASSKFVVAKNPMNYGMAYGEFSQATYILDTPGPTPATLKHVTYKHLQTPYFPATEEIRDWQPTIFRSEPRQFAS